MISTTKKFDAMDSVHNIVAKRLENADKALGIGTQGALQDFSTQPPVTFMFDQFAQEMLAKPSQSTSVADI